MKEPKIEGVNKNEYRGTIGLNKVEREKRAEEAVKIAEGLIGSNKRFQISWGVKNAGNYSYWYSDWKDGGLRAHPEKDSTKMVVEFPDQGIQLWTPDLRIEDGTIEISKQQAEYLFSKAQEFLKTQEVK